MKHHLIAIRDAALKDGNTGFAASLEAMYQREYGRPMPSPAASAVAEYLNSKPPFAAISNDHPTH